MKLQPRDIENFLKTPPSCLGVLVYGPDTGLVSTRSTQLAKHIAPDINDPFSVVNLEADKLKDDPALLSDELTAMNFGGGKRLVRLRAENGSGLAPVIASTLQNLPKDIAKDAFLLIMADDLPATSALRKLFETDASLVAIPCYVEDARDLKAVIATEMKKRNIHYTPETAEYLSQHCQGDRLVIVSEIAKLDLYLGESRKATPEIVESCTGTSTESSLDDICNAAGEGNLVRLEEHLRRAYHQGQNPVAILRAAQRHYLRLQRVVALTQQGLGQEQAIGALRPPVFFKQKPSFTRQVGRWVHPQRKTKLPQALNTIYQAELACKSTGADMELMCSRALTQLAAMGGK